MAKSENLGECSNCGSKRVVLCSTCVEDNGIKSLEFSKLRLCVDCNRAYEGPTEACPSCLSTSYLSVPSNFGSNKDKQLEAQLSYICPPCGVVFQLDATSQCCPSCGSKLVVSVAELIGRNDKTEGAVFHGAETDFGTYNAPFRSGAKVAVKSYSSRFNWK